MTTDYNYTPAAQENAPDGTFCVFGVMPVKINRNGYNPKYGLSRLSVAELNDVCGCVQIQKGGRQWFDSEAKAAEFAIEVLTDRPWITDAMVLPAN